MRSIDYGNYETSLTVENLDGLTESDISDTIQKAHDMTNASMAIYLNAKETQIQALPKRKSIAETYNDLAAARDLRDNVPPTEAERIANLPVYQPKGSKVVKK